MVNFCCIPQCSSRSNRDSLSYYRFPKDKKLKKLWKVKIGRGNSFEPTRNTRVCSKHFRSGKQSLDPNSVDYIPSIFPFTKLRTAAKSGVCESCRRKRCTCNITKGYLPAVTFTPTISEVLIEVIDEPEEPTDPRPPANQTVNSETQTDFKAFGSIVSDYIDKLNMTIRGLRELLEEQREINVKLKSDMNTQRIELEGKLHTTKNEIENLQNFGKQCLRVENCTKSDKSTRLFTGFSNYATFQFVFMYFERLAVNMRYWEGRSTEVQKTGQNSTTKRPNKAKIDLQNQFFITMCRLRRGFEVRELAFFFGVSVGTISRIVITWLRLIDSELPILFPAVPLQKVISTNPSNIKVKYPRLYGILDCTEFFIDTPSSLQAQSACYSQYKHHTTYKVLYLTAVNGAILFVSPVFSGRTSDKQIVHESKILEFIPPNSQILADKGFEIETECRLKNIELTIPPFKGSRLQLSEEEVWRTEVIANSRIHVERAIRRVKTFNILGNDLPLSMSTTVSMIIRIVSYFQNFLDPNMK